VWVKLRVSTFTDRPVKSSKNLKIWRNMPPLQRKQGSVVK
jgi:hypothetical protein